MWWYERWAHTAWQGLASTNINSSQAPVTAQCRIKACDPKICIDTSGLCKLKDRKQRTEIRDSGITRVRCVWSAILSSNLYRPPSSSPVSQQVDFKHRTKYLGHHITHDWKYQNQTIFFLLLFLFVVCFCKAGFLCVALGYAGTCFVDQGRYKLRNPLASASQVTGLKVCATTDWLKSLSLYHEASVFIIQKIELNIP